MSNGVLGKVMSSAGNEVTVYTVPPAADFATISINIVNKGTGDAKVKIAITTSAIPSPADYIDFESIVPGNGGILERTCIVCSASENVIIEGDTSDLAVRVYGLEKLA